MSNLTNLPNGLSSFGIPVYPYSNLIHTGSSVRNGESNAIGNTHYWVNGNVGSDGNDGLSPQSPKLTMAAVFTALNSGDIVHVNGNITEQLTTPAGIFDVTIIGEANLPRNADTHTTSNGYSSATWKYPASPTAATSLLKIQQQGWRIVNILFSGSLTSTPDILIFRDGGAGNAERDGSHTQIIGCRFDGGVDAIRGSGGPNFVQIINCAFRGFTTTAISNVTGAGIGTNLNWLIQDNRFHDNVNHVVVPLNQSTVMGNIFGKFTTTSLSTAGGTGSNVITLNYLSGTYSISGGYTGSASDEWGANMNSIAGGWTAADPA